MLIRVALPVPLYREYDYLPLASSHSSPLVPPVGGRVQVPFGARTLLGIVVAHIPATASDVPSDKLKAIYRIVDTAPILDDGMLALSRWLASYYHYPLGDVLSVMLPTLIRQGKPLDLLITHWRVKANIDDTDFNGKAHPQKQQFAMLKLHGKKGASEDTLLLEGMQRPFLKRLEQKGLIERYVEPKQPPKPVTLAKLPLSLNDEQAHAVDTIVQAYHHQTYHGYLLNGITGSGKTEVYLQAMQPILAAGKQVLVLVPEIGLTPQTRARFAQRFAANILLLHSGVNDAQRLHGWEDCRQGRAQIIIGTRSAILYPYANLGLIVVDEAHDPSYKQQDYLRYHAANVALYRGYQAKIPVVLGTATPSLEHLKLVDDSKITELLLTQRAGNANKAKMQLVDARDKPTKYSDLPVNNGTNNSVHHSANNGTNPDSNTPQHQAQPSRQPNLLPHLLPNLQSAQNTGLTDATIGAIAKTLAAGEQVLLFLNRRGYAPILLCAACGWQADCARCDAHLTLHHSQLNAQRPSYLKCHHCDWQAPIPQVCPACSSPNLDAVGIGTTRLTESLHAVFANPQTSKTIYPIIQIDRDTTRRKDSWENIYRRINTGEPAILVGTQMVAKGHHFPNVTLVCMPNADRGFLSPDFRSPEHTAQLIIQVAGRAGRGDKPGKVLIQTLQPENPLLLKLVREGYAAFALALLQERKMLGLPPFTHSALIRCEGKTQARATQALSAALAILPAHRLAILGPIDAPMKRKNSRFHVQLLLLAKQRSHLHEVLDLWWPQVLQLPTSKYLKLSLDIDPIAW